MTQQPMWPGVDPGAQQYPPQAPPQQGPPQWAGQPQAQAQPQQGWGQQPGPAPAMQASANPAEISGGFFGGMSSGGSGTPSYKWGHVGDVVQGVVTSCEVIEISDYTTGEKVIDQQTGQPAKQLAITLQTSLRNWDKVAKIPVDDQGAPKPPHEDTGLRSIYTGGKRSDGQSWMSGAIREAMQAAGRDPARGLEVGAMLGVSVKEEVPSGKGNPYRTYLAKYVSPGQHAGVPPAPQQPQAQPQQQAPQNVTQQPGYNGLQQGYQPQQPPAAPPQGDNAWGGQQGFPPPAPQQGGGLPQPPQANPFGGAQQGDVPAF